MTYLDRKGIWVHDPASTGIGGQKLDANFSELGDRTGPYHLHAFAPTANDDSANTGTNGIAQVNSVWYNSLIGRLYRCVDATPTAAVWVSERGETGETGPQGIQGTVGEQGIQGTVGEQGIQGTVGETGDQGIQGTVGETGPEGPAPDMTGHEGSVLSNDGSVLEWIDAPVPYTGATADVDLGAHSLFATSLNAGDTNNNIRQSFAPGTITSNPLYTNPGGSGNRTASITVTSALTGQHGTLSTLVDGNTGHQDFWVTGGQNITDVEVFKFDFGVGANKYITEAKVYISGWGATSVRWQGSNNNSTWTNIGSPFAITGTQTCTELSSNNAGYRYYRLLGVSGVTGTENTINEWEFKIDNFTTVSYGYIQTYVVNGDTVGGNLVLEYLGGNVGIGLAPTARLHLPTGTTAASSAPLKFTSGALMTAPEAGAIEFLTDDLCFTITTSAARVHILTDNGTTLTSTRIPYATTNGRLTDNANLIFDGTSLIASSIRAPLYDNEATPKLSVAPAERRLYGTDGTTPVIDWSYNYLNARHINPYAGTTAAGTAPIKFNSGSLNTTPEEGAIEYQYGILYFTENTPTRTQIITDNGTALVSTRIPIIDANSHLTDSASIKVTNDVLTSLKGITIGSSSGTTVSNESLTAYNDSTLHTPIIPTTISGSYSIVLILGSDSGSWSADGQGHAITVTGSPDSITVTLDFTNNSSTHFQGTGTGSPSGMFDIIDPVNGNAGGWNNGTLTANTGDMGITISWTWTSSVTVTGTFSDSTGDLVVTSSPDQSYSNGSVNYFTGQITLPTDITSSTVAYEYTAGGDNATLGKIIYHNDHYYGYRSTGWVQLDNA